MVCPSVQIQEYLYSFQTMCYKYELWSFFFKMVLLFNPKRGGIVNCPSACQSVRIYMLHSIVHQPTVTLWIIKIFLWKGMLLFEPKWDDIVYPPVCLSVRSHMLHSICLILRRPHCMFVRLSGVICYTALFINQMLHYEL